MAASETASDPLLMCSCEQEYPRGNPRALASDEETKLGLRPFDGSTGSEWNSQ